jgi:hypothetical protein
VHVTRRWSLFAAVLAAPACLAGCREATGPSFAVDVRVASRQEPVVAVVNTGFPRITCGFTLQASVAGHGRAAWLGATAYFFPVNDLHTAFDSLAFSAATVQAAWGGEYVATDTSRTSGWYFYASVPFVVRIAYLLQPQTGAVDTAAVTFTCAPSLPQGGGPVVTELAEDPSSRLESGEAAAFDVADSSAVGLWVSTLSLSGPCDTTLVFADPLQHVVSRVARVTLPQACGLGTTLVVTATVWDAELRTAQRTLALPALVDTTPPTLMVDMPLPYRGGSRDWGVLGGDVFGGDSIQILVLLQDNHALRSLSWALAPEGAGDSVIVSGAAFEQWLGIPTAAGWSGPVRLSLWATDASGNSSPVLESAPDSIRLHPSLAPPAVRGSVPSGTQGVVWDTRRGRLYVNESLFGHIYAVDAATGAVSVFMSIGEIANSLSLSPGGDSLLMVLPGSRSLGVVGLGAPVPTLDSLPLSGIDTTLALGSMVATAGGKLLLVAGDGAVTRLYSFDLATDSLRLRLDAGEAGDVGAGRLGVSPGGAVAVLNGGPGKFQRYDAATDAFGVATTARDTFAVPEVDSAGDVIAVGHDLYDGSLRYLRTPDAVNIVFGGPPIALSPDGGTMYFGLGNVGIIRSNVADGTTRDRLRVPIATNAMYVSPDGRAMYVIAGATSGSFDQICLVDLTQAPAAPAAATAAMPAAPPPARAARGSRAPAPSAARRPPGLVAGGGARP